MFGRHPELQQERPAHEKVMPEWERNALDRARELIRKNARDNPAICAALDRIENKQDEILTMLRAIVGQSTVGEK